MSPMITILYYYLGGYTKYIFKVLYDPESL